MRRFDALITGSLCCMAAAACGADVSGQIALASRRPAREAVVYLEGANRSTPMTKAVVDQRAKTFIPHVLVVTQGTTVQFPNNDSVFHNVFAYYNAKKFDLGMYPRGATKPVTFDKTGVVALFCNVHSEMSAYIMVVDTPYFAVTDKQGRYHIRDVAPGAYTVHCWHESGSVSEQSITVTAKDSDLNLTLSRK